MKKDWIYILLAAALAAVACTGRNASCKSVSVLEYGSRSEKKRLAGRENEPDNLGMSTIVIDYGTVEGFGVTVRLFPENRMTPESCQALIDLDCDGVHRLFLHNTFRDPENADTLACGTVLKRQYQLPEGAEDRRLSLGVFSQMPFFFLDVDFDGEKELVLTQANQGQRWIDAFQPIHLEYDYLYDNLKEMPFTDLDSTSEIDYDKKTIKLFTHVGAGSWFEEVYAYKRLDDEMLSIPELVSHTKTEYDTWNENDPKKRIITERGDTTKWMVAKEYLKKQ